MEDSGLDVEEDATAFAILNTWWVSHQCRQQYCNTRVHWPGRAFRGGDRWPAGRRGEGAHRQGGGVLRNQRVGEEGGDVQDSTGCVSIELTMPR